LPFLRFFNRVGDANLAVYEHRKKNPKVPLPADLETREKNKYLAYKNFDRIYFNEDEE
jgi:hypothetical protein